MSRFYYLNPYFAGRTGVFTQFSLWLRPKYNNYGAKVDLPAFYLLSRVHCLTLPDAVVSFQWLWSNYYDYGVVRRLCQPSSYSPALTTP